MSEESTRKFPYKSLGKHLKQMREKKRETQAEVSGAVEIDVETLNKYEQGLERPSEDILLLLLSHFGLRDADADRLWELAEFEHGDMKIVNLLSSDSADTRPAAIVMPNDARIVYTDLVHVVINNYGVVINFMQASGPAGQSMIVSRLGMSREHAKSLLEVLKHTIEQSEPKALPEPGKKTDQKRNHRSKKSD